MRILPASPEGIAVALQTLQSGGTVIHATETCYGCACDLTNPKAVTRLFAIKQRPIHQPVSALFSSVEKAKRYVEWNDRAEELAKEFLPGPLTLILPASKDMPHIIYITPLIPSCNRNATNPKERMLHPLVPRSVSKSQESAISSFDIFVAFQTRSGMSELPTTRYPLSASIGLRISSHSLATELVTRFGKPMSTTSANIHGKPSPYTIEEIVEQYKNTPEKPDLILDSGTLPLRKPSRIIDCTGTSATILRA